MSKAVPRRIHHLDIVVRDLDRAIVQYRRVLGTEPGRRESLPARGVDLVRFRIGETWLILVQPTSNESPVWRYLEQHGEGFFHMALEVEDVESAAAALHSRGVRLSNPEPRLGLEGWKLVDLEVADTAGAMIQLAETAEAR